jgi:hypothetical protein
MSRTLTASSGLSTPMWRRNDRGELFQIEEVDRNEYVSPPRGTRGRFSLSGISDTFEMTSEQYGTSTNVRLEFFILRVTNKDFKWAEGKRFTQLVTWKIGPKSTFGQLLGVLRGRSVAPGEELDPDAFIGTSFVTSTTLKENGDRLYAGISIEAIEDGSVKLSPFVNGGGAPQPELVGVAASGGDDSDPFADTMEDDL